jgi:hypothetical protein
MTWLLLLLVVALLGSIGSTVAPAADFYVATRGRDTWSGRLAVPNAGRTDGPFASVARAQQAVPLSRRQPQLRPCRGEHQRMQLHPPRLRSSSPRGLRTARPLIAANAARPPVFSGGVRLAVHGCRRRLAATIPEVARGMDVRTGHPQRQRPAQLRRARTTSSPAPCPPRRERRQGYDRFRLLPVTSRRLARPQRCRGAGLPQLDDGPAAHRSWMKRSASPSPARPSPDGFLRPGGGRRYIVENARGTHRTGRVVPGSSTACSPISPCPARV